MRKILFLLSISILLSSCTSYVKPKVNYQNLSSKLSIGMTQNEVIKILGYPYKKQIESNKEVFYYISRGEVSATTKILNRTVLLVPNVLYSIVKPEQILSEEAYSSELTLKFDENSKLEEFK